MDAQQPMFKARFKNPAFMRALVVRVIEAWLALVLAIGLWQGYGAWLVNSRGGDVF